MRPPDASSHIRVGVMKYAIAGSANVYQAEKTNDARNSPRTVNPTSRRDRPNFAPRRNARPMIHRPDEVELLFDRQRPEVLHRGGCIVGRQIVDAGDREVPIDDVQCRRHDLPAGVRPDRLGRDEEGGDADDEEDEQRRGKQPLDPSGPEVRDITPAARGLLVEVAGDEGRPEMTKKISTPTNPPSNVVGHRWYSSTTPTASARSPWMSDRKPEV
jgi:hypothetical protein